MFSLDVSIFEIGFRMEGNFGFMAITLKFTFSLAVRKDRNSIATVA